MPDKPSQRVVIADDEAMMRQFLKAILDDAGYQVVGQASNGKEAVALCQQKNPDLVCLDIIMPSMDGISALKQLRKELPALTAVMISGETSQDHVKESIKLGARGFICKPFNAERVIERIAKALCPTCED